MAVKQIRQLIRGGEGGYEANAELTKEIKGASVPLVGGKADTGGINLFQAISSTMLDDYAVFAGVKFVSEKYDVAATLHDGAVIPVTERMRTMFKMLWWASEGAIDPSQLTGRAAELWRLKQTGWYPLSDSTTAIVIPGRPFIERAFESGQLKREAQRNWEQALASVFRVLAKGG
jgi:hypothetical protein